MILSPPLFLMSIYSLWMILVSAANPTSFCKCTCFNNNSTIIALDSPSRPSSDGHSFLLRRSDPAAINDVETKEGDSRKENRAGNCNDCNRQFCLDYNLPICKGANVEDVFTTCFQRDSAKDETVVFIFIFATAGLLGWSLIRPWVNTWVQSARERRSYIPVSNPAEQ